MELDEIRGRLSRGELLAQLAEEAAELSHAALKLRRVLDGVNPTPIHPETAEENLLEEVADVDLCLRLLGVDDPKNTIGMYRTMERKAARWSWRLQNRKEEQTDADRDH